ncbi:hypothetical protein A0H81_02231 [Grifola frondosa]|uniref:Uncharacterized protein n=1 Tax=Grifola frondosa TaxID=5627 RepID=A0A1C7MM75_GRIFR|nr:hypothetical protein A0H81_02231 [Grifola frondosa]
MGRVRSRKFCCCLPVRFGVFCSSLIGIVAGGFFSIVLWIEVHKISTGQILLSAPTNIVIWIAAFSFTFMLFDALLGMIGCLFRFRRFVNGYAASLVFDTLFNISIGSFFLFQLFHQDGADEVTKCVDGTTGDVGDVKNWACQKGFDVLRIVVVVLFVILWLFEIAGCFIVYDYVGQLRDEQEAEQALSMPQQQIAVSAPYPATTYRTPTYGGPGDMEAGKSPYTFTAPANAYGSI